MFSGRHIWSCSNIRSLATLFLIYQLTNCSHPHSNSLVIPTLHRLPSTNTTGQTSSLQARSKPCEVNRKFNYQWKGIHAGNTGVAFILKGCFFSVCVEVLSTASLQMMLASQSLKMLAHKKKDWSQMLSFCRTFEGLDCFFPSVWKF